MNSKYPQLLTNGIANIVRPRALSLENEGPKSAVATKETDWETSFIKENVHFVGSINTDTIEKGWL